jgi:hypothetical protein
LIRDDRLFRKRFAISLSPGAVSRHRFHWRPTTGPAGAWTLSLGLGQAGTRLGFQATAHVNDIFLNFFLIRKRILSFGTCLDQG